MPHQGALPFLPTAREGNVFTGVCHSVHNRPHAYSVTAHPCWLFVHCYGAVGTHPTGMLSCFWGARMPHAMRIFAKGLTFFHIVFFFFLVQIAGSQIVGCLQKSNTRYVLHVPHNRHGLRCQCDLSISCYLLIWCFLLYPGGCQLYFSHLILPDSYHHLPSLLGKV